MNLNLESDRLRTFEIWPLSVYLVDPRQWARNGFFAVNEMEAECNWCHQRIIARCDQIEERHRALQPRCAFILDAQGCGNMPMDIYNVCSQQASVPTPSSSGVTSAPSSDCEPRAATQSTDLLVETNRLATFKNWPNPNISPESLAKAGFFYLNRSDEVKCAWCKGVIAKWEKQDNAFEEHKRFFPDCPRVQLGPLIEMTSDGIRDLGIQQISTPKKPKFSSLDARMRTYLNWPIGEIQQADALAQAGLYYQNVDDQVRCFHCNIGLRSWQKEDDPWFEHAKWYPQCHFVRLVKGVNYIRHVQERTRQLSQRALPSATSIEEAMTTPPVLQALEMGIDGGAIRNATQRQLSSTGRPYNTVEDLIKAIFANRSDADEDSEHATLDDDVVAGASASEFIDFSATEAENRLNTNYSDAVQTAGDECLSTAPTPTNASVLIPNADEAQTTPCQSVCTNKQTPAAPWTEVATTQNMSLEEENRKLKDARLCKVCLDEEVGVVFLPCGHLVTCVQCAPGVNQCPMCRTTIKGFVRTFLS